MRSRSFETRSLPSSLATTHRGFAFYVAFPKSSIRPVGLPIYVARLPRLHSLVATLGDFTFYLGNPFPRLFVCHDIVENRLSYRQRPIRPLARVA